MTITTPDITGLPERDQPTRCILQTSGKTLPILKEAFVKLILGRGALTTWVFVGDIIDESSLSLDVMHADASVDLRRHVLRQGDEKCHCGAAGPILYKGQQRSSSGSV